MPVAINTLAIAASSGKAGGVAMREAAIRDAIVANKTHYRTVAASRLGYTQLSQEKIYGLESKGSNRAGMFKEKVER